MSRLAPRRADDRAVEPDALNLRPERAARLRGRVAYVGVTAFDAVDCGLVPFPFVAATLNT